MKEIVYNVSKKQLINPEDWKDKLEEARKRSEEHTNQRRRQKAIWGKDRIAEVD